jgi:hypothetical protein
LKGEWCKRISIYSLTFPCYILLLPLLICVTMYIWPCLYYIYLLATLNAPCQHIDLWLSGQVCHQWRQHLASIISHIKMGSCDPMVPSDGQWTFIFGRLGTRWIGTVVLL